MRKNKMTMSRLVKGALLGGTCVMAACGPAEFEYTYTPATSPQAPQQFAEREYIIDPGVAPDGTAPVYGTVKNRLTGDYVGQAELYTKGITPPTTGTADGNGSYSIDVAVGSVFWLQAYKAGYAYTYQKVDMTAPAAQYEVGAYIVNQADIDAMATAFGVTQYAGCGTVVGKAEYGNTAQDGVDVIEFGGASYDGPYFLDPNNVAAPAATYTSTSGYFVFFNVCDEGAQTVTEGKAVTVQANGTYYGAKAYLNVYPAGVTLTKIQVEENGTPPPPPPPEDVIDFQIYIMPIFAKNGCQGCHYNDPGAAAYDTDLWFNVDPEAVYYQLTSVPGVVNLEDPAASYVLTKPLYEEPPNHQNASFDSVEHPDYVQLLQWIEQGAPYGVEPPPPVDLGPPEYIADIHPIWTNRGCVACHSGGNISGGLDLGDEPYVVQEYIEQYLIDVDYPEYSSLLNNPYCGDDGATKCANAPYGRQGETHGTEVFVTDQDPDYQKIKAWLEYRAPQIVPLAPEYEYAVNVALEDQLYRLAVMECNRCHSKGDYANYGNLKLEGTQYEIYQSMTDAVENTNVVYPNDPEQSYLYTKPNAYYVDVNHGGPKDVLDRLDPFAVYMGGWLYEGAAPVLDEYPAWEDIYPLFGANYLNCTGCHGAAGGSGGLNLDGDPADIYTNVIARVDVANYYPQASVIMQKPFVGNYLYAEYNHSGPKRQIAQYYDEYRYLEAWIAAGAPGPQ